MMQTAAFIGKTTLWKPAPLMLMELPLRSEEFISHNPEMCKNLENTSFRM